ncbi:MAG TPA: hypothetical protein VJR24_08230 [Gemmatimonadaceae bacterium]|nr:hypothetical protein [Gemmatimonadaceae bacterium]
MSDTPMSVARMQLAAQRRLTGEQRLALAFEMSRLARQLLIARLGQEHPDWSLRQIEREVLRSAFLTEGASAELPLPLR